MKKHLVLIALFGLIVIMTSCQQPEEVTLSQYFQAMAHNDRDSMASMALEPKNIEYKSFEVITIAEPVIGEYALPALIQESTQIKKDMTDKAREASDNRDEMLDIQDEIDETRSRRRKKELQEEMTAAQEAFKAAESQYKELVKERDRVKREIEKERTLVRLSANIDNRAEIYQGEVHTIRTDVKITLPEGEVKDYVFVLIKYMLKVDERVLPNRYILLKIQTLEDFNAEEAAAALVKEMEKEKQEEVGEEEVKEETEEAPAKETTEGEQK
jgi:hypothetical protein